MRDRRRIVAFCRIQRNLWLLSSARAELHVKGIARGRTAGGPEYTCNLFPFFFLYVISLASGVYLRQGETNAPDYFSRIRERVSRPAAVLVFP